MSRVIAFAGLSIVALCAAAQEAPQQQQAPAPVAGAPLSGAKSKDADEASRAAWQQALNELVGGVTPADVKEYRKAQSDIERAAAPRAAVKDAHSDAVVVSLAPGSTSPQVSLLHGYVTAIEILDETGQPWPIVSATVGDKAAIDEKIEGVQSVTSGQNLGGTQQQPAEKAGPSSFGNVITVNPLTKFTATNLIVVLQGQSRPIDLVLVAEESTANTVMRDRITLLVGGHGPNARIEAIANLSLIDAGDDLRRTLVGQAPTSDAGEVLADLPSDIRAWTDGAQLWVRSEYRVLSPAPQASVAMGDVRAYRLPYLPVIVIAKDGSLQNVSVPRGGTIKGGAQ